MPLEDSETDIINVDGLASEKTLKGSNAKDIKALLDAGTPLSSRHASFLSNSSNSRRSISFIDQNRLLEAISVADIFHHPLHNEAMDKIQTIIDRGFEVDQAIQIFCGNHSELMDGVPVTPGGPSVEEWKRFFRILPKYVVTDEATCKQDAPSSQTSIGISPVNGDDVLYVDFCPAK